MTGQFTPDIWGRAIEESLARTSTVQALIHAQYTPAQWDEMRQQAVAKRAEIEDRHRAALASYGPFRRAILELHAPVFWRDGGPSARCEGCDFGGYEGDAPDFPCRTYSLAIGDAA